MIFGFLAIAAGSAIAMHCFIEAVMAASTMTDIPFVITAIIGVTIGAPAVPFFAAWSFAQVHGWIIALLYVWVAPFVCFLSGAVIMKMGEDRS